MRTYWSGPILVVVSMLLIATGSLEATPGNTIYLMTHTFDPGEAIPEVPASLSAPEPIMGQQAYYLVQLGGPPTEERKASIVSGGGELIAYVPDHTYIVRMDPATREAIISSPQVRWVGPYHPAYRLDSMIGQREFHNPERASDPLHTLRIRVFDDLDETAGQIQDLGAEILETVDDGFQKTVVARAAPEILEDIARLARVWWIEEKPEFFLMNNDTKWVVQSNVSGNTPIWDKGLHGENQLAVVMDSGLDYNSCWFRDGGSAPGPSHRKVINYSLYGGNAYDGCDTGHGTHVCGTLAGDQSYVNPGNYSYNGMAYKAKLAMQDVGEDDVWSCTVGAVNVPSSLTSAYNAAYNLGGRVHSNSWGSTENSYDSYAVNVDNFMWGHPDFLVVFACGNSGSGSSTVGFPGTAKNCVTVGATRRPPQQSTIAGYSSRGPTSDNRYKPTVVAPGGEAGYGYINSADNHAGNPPAQTCSMVSSPFQGTSMAAPAVAGCALLVRQYYTEGWYPSGTLTGADALVPSAAVMKATLLNSATDIGTANIPNNDEGWGRVLLEDALYFQGDARELIVEDVAPGVAQGQTQSFQFEVDSSTVPLEIVLVWTDYPGTAGTSVAIQNNLNLTVTAPGGTQYRGNVFSGGQSIAGGSYDTRNVEEAVRRNSPSLGTYTVDVNGAVVPHAPQPFALVTTGSFANWPQDPTGVADGELTVAGKPFEIQSISPNPFNPSTTIAYRLNPVSLGMARATLKIYGVDGRVVTTLVDRVQDPGLYSVIWNGRSSEGVTVSSGVYFCELAYGGEKETRKVILLK
ncbi:MAG: S8 family serine peptidase [Candidatus Eisenbacteria sp.]|nr:S8 family serine peptidase [Candidatus Eisenbacteria bacterium]